MLAESVRHAAVDESTLATQTSGCLYTCLMSLTEARSFTLCIVPSPLPECFLALSRAL